MHAQPRVMCSTSKWIGALHNRYMLSNKLLDRQEMLLHAAANAPAPLGTRAVAEALATLATRVAISKYHVAASDCAAYVVQSIH
jgi:hypothetical protein